MHRSWLIAVALGTLLVGSPKAHAEDSIIFLHVRFDSAGARLDSTVVVPGKLKSKAHATAHGDQLTFRVLGPDSTVLHSEAIDDPRFVVREYAKEDGTLGRVVEERASGVAVIRFPFDVRAARVEFTPAADAPATARVRPLGSVQLDLSEHEKK